MQVINSMSNSVIRNFGTKMQNDIASFVTFILLKGIQYGALVLALVVFVSGFFE